MPRNNMDLNTIRTNIPTSQKYVYLNHAACAPLPTPVKKAQKQYIHTRALDAEVVFDTWLNHADDTRKLVADFINGTPEEIAFLKNTSEGINTAARMLHYNSGQNVVTTDLEFPSNYMPWLNLRKKGVEFRVVQNTNGRLLLEDFEKTIDDNTKCVAVSHVEFATGFKNNLKALSELCQDHNAYFFVDPIQSLGAVDIDVNATHIDFFSSGCYKWLLSELGISIFYIRKNVLDQFSPVDVGWFSLKDYENYEFFDRENPEIADTARKFECGNLNFYGIYTLHASISFLNLYPEREKRVMELSRYLMDTLTDKGFSVQTPPEHAGIVNFKVKNPEKTVESLKKKGIIVSTRARGIRVSPHFWNTTEELDTLINAL